MKKSYLLLLISILGLFLTSCKKQVSEENKKTIINITTYTVTQKEYTPILRYTGDVYPYDEALVGSTMPGMIDEIYVKEGEYVSKGRLLAKVMSELLVQTEAKLEALEKNYKRIKSLYKKGSVSAKEYDKIKAEYTAAKAQYDMAQKISLLKAPISGKVVEIKYKPLETVSPIPEVNMSYSGIDAKNYIFRIMDMSMLKVKIRVPQDELLKIKQVKKAYIVFNNKKYVGKIIDYPDYLRKTDRTGEIEILLKRFPRTLIPGMNVDVEIPLKKQEVIMIPLETLLKDPISRKYYVFVVENNSVKKVYVERGKSVEGYAIITKGLKVSDKVVLKGAHTVNENSIINIVEK